MNYCIQFKFSSIDITFHVQPNNIFEVVVGYLNYSNIFEFCKHTILLSSGRMLNLYFSREKEERVQLLFNENRDFFFKIRIQTNGMVCYA